jgi:hypothetical protein
MENPNILTGDLDDDVVVHGEEQLQETTQWREAEAGEVAGSIRQQHPLTREQQ